VYDLAEPLTQQTPRHAVQPPFSLALLRRHGDTQRPDGGSTALDTLSMTGHTGTHVDAFCHASHRGMLLGGIDAAADSVGGTHHTHGVETIEPFLCRGVLLDVPRALGREALEPGHAVTAGDLAAAADAQGVALQPGDAVLVRTGRPLETFPDADRPREAAVAGVPGVDVGGARWLLDHGVRVTGADTLTYEWLAPGDGPIDLPVHTLLLCHAGVHIIELLALEELALDRVYEFLFVATPLSIVGGTGSPLRPLAVLGQ
jgi:kynurenine formamidase